MKKEEILAKARQGSKDEREVQVNNYAFRMGWVGVTAVMVFLMVWRAYHRESATDILMILMTQIVASAVYQYVKMPEKKIYLVIIIGGLLAFGLALSSLLSEYGVY